MRFWVLAIVLWLSGTPLMADSMDDGGTQSPLMVGSGARELGMGRTGVATSSSADALFWNPARLVNLEHSELTLFRSDLYVDGGSYHSVFLTYPTLDLGSLALGFQRLHVSDIQRTDERNRSLGSFDNGESNLLLGYGRTLGSLVSLGSTLRIVQQSVDATGDVGVGLDLGLAFQHPLGSTDQHKLLFAANLQNLVEPKLRLAGDEVPDPFNLKLGAGYGGSWPARRLSWVTAFDMDLPRTARPRPGWGLELSYQGILALRTGIDRSAPTFGVGITYGNFRLDYALLSNPTMDRNDRLSVALRFGASLSAKRQKRMDAYQRSVSRDLGRLLREREQTETSRATAEADSSFAARDFDTALRLYRRVLMLAPADEHASNRVTACEVETRLHDAAQLFAAGNVGQAAAAYQGILEQWPQEERAETGLAVARERIQHAADQASMLRDLFKEAIGRFTTGDLPEAETTLEELLRIAPQDELARELLENVQKERTRQGRRHLQEARQQGAAGNFDHALHELAEARRLLGAREELDSLRKTWEEERSASQSLLGQPAPGTGPQKEDTSPRVRSRRVLTAQETRELEKHYRSGMEAFARRDFQSAIRDWRSVWVDAPDFEAVGSHLIKAYLLEGVEMYSRGEYDDALDRCARALEIDPTNEKARRYMERIQEEKSELDQIGGGR